MPQHITYRILLSCFCILFFISCSSPAPTSAPLLPTETLLPYPRGLSTAEASLAAETPTTLPTPAPEVGSPRYVLDLQLNYSAKAAIVNETIIYPNWTGETLTNLVLAVEPNLWSGGFSLKSLAVDDQPVTNYTLETMSQRLEIQLPQPLPPSGTITITMSYGLILPQMQAYSNAPMKSARRSMAIRRGRSTSWTGTRSWCRISRARAGCCITPGITANI